MTSSIFPQGRKISLGKQERVAAWLQCKMKWISDKRTFISRENPFLARMKIMTHYITGNLKPVFIMPDKSNEC